MQCQDIFNDNPKRNPLNSDNVCKIIRAVVLFRKKSRKHISSKHFQIKNPRRHIENETRFDNSLLIFGWPTIIENFCHAKKKLRNEKSTGKFMSVDKHFRIIKFSLVMRSWKLKSKISVDEENENNSFTKLKTRSKKVFQGKF